MQSETIVALLGFFGTLVGSLFGVLAAQKLVQYRLQKLEEKVEAHNKIVERTYKLEGEMRECIRDIASLRKYHQP
ncbi:MAG: hypothetical protein IKZ21_00610 [Clostridia bacterium]|nr:hypothetical protein [Clostridia bacterium]